MKKMKKEVWKNVKGYEESYCVNNFGIVKSNHRVVYRVNKFGTKIKQIIPEKIKKGSFDKDGYLKIGLWKNNKCKTVSIHKIVAIAFIPNPNKLPQINHIDEVKSNNSVDNLEWITAIDNINHGTGIKRSVKSRIKNICQYNLKGEFIRIWNGVPDIASFYNISDKAIYRSLDKPNKKSHGFIWKKSKEFNPKRIEPYIHSKSFTVYQYTKDKHLLNAYKSTVDASYITGIGRSNITHCLNGTKNSKAAGGFLWSKSKLT